MHTATRAVLATAIAATALGAAAVPALAQGQGAPSYTISADFGAPATASIQLRGAGDGTGTGHCSITGTLPDGTLVAGEGPAQWQDFAGTLSIFCSGEEGMPLGLTRIFVPDTETHVTDVPLLSVFKKDSAFPGAADIIGNLDVTIPGPDLALAACHGKIRS